MNDTPHDFGLYARTQEKLHELPQEYRWEFTRRHPYYLVCWALAKAHLAGQTADEPEVDALTHGALHLLRYIGVSGEPVDPATPFEQLDEGTEVDPDFLSGAVQPMTCRKMIEFLIAGLPPAELTRVANFMDAANSERHAVPDDDKFRTFQRLKVAEAVQYVESVAFDSYVDAPFYFINMSASQRAITESIESQVRKWKQRLGIGDTRQHTTKLDVYLKVWDMRTGWTGRGYELSQCRSLKQVAKSMGVKPSTVKNQYSSAFERITGWPYKPDLWVRFFAPLFSSDKAELAREYVHRFNKFSQSQSVSIVPETTLKSRNKEESPGLTASLSDKSDQDFKDTFADASIFIGEGKSNEEIHALLNIDMEIIDLIRDELSNR